MVLQISYKYHNIEKFAKPDAKLQENGIKCPQHYCLHGPKVKKSQRMANNQKSDNVLENEYNKDKIFLKLFYIFPAFWQMSLFQSGFMQDTNVPFVINLFSICDLIHRQVCS